MSTLYESILSLCTERGITGGKMCVDLGLSKSLMTDLKKNRKTGISAKTAQKIADYFGVTVGRVLGSEEDMSIELVQSTLSQSEIEAWKTIQQTASRVLGSEQKEKSPTPEGAEPFPGYSDLTEEEKCKVSEYIDLLLAARQKR